MLELAGGGSGSSERCAAVIGKEKWRKLAFLPTTIRSRQYKYHVEVLLIQNPKSPSLRVDLNYSDDHLSFFLRCDKKCAGELVPCTCTRYKVQGIAATLYDVL